MPTTLFHLYEAFTKVDMVTRLRRHVLADNILADNVLADHVLVDWWEVLQHLPFYSAGVVNFWGEGNVILM